MSRRSQTDLAVLGALSTGAMTGYEVRMAITETLGHFWNESYGQIYPALASLETSGLVRRTTPGRTSGTRFEITTAGIDRLEALLVEPHHTPTPRNGLLLRLFFGTHLPTGAADALLAEARDRATTALTGYAAIREEIAGDRSPEQAFRTLTLSYGEHIARATLAWAEESLSELPTIEREAGRARG